LRWGRGALALLKAARAEHCEHAYSVKKWAGESRV